MDKQCTSSHVDVVCCSGCAVCGVQSEFHARIAFCLNLHNEAVKAMRFEPDAHKRALAAANGRSKDFSVEEIARAIEEEEEDEDDGF
jgi:hypothetical protein